MSSSQAKPRTILLRGITWHHTRGLLPMVATSQRFHELFPHIDIAWTKRPPSGIRRQAHECVPPSTMLGGAGLAIILEPADIWCAEVLDWQSLLEHEGYKVLEMEQTVRRGSGFEYRTTACPIRINGERPRATSGSPALGEHTRSIRSESSL